MEKQELLYMIHIMHAVIFSGGEITWSKRVEQDLTAADMILAADSGAISALAYGIRPTAVIGDFDSIDAKTKEILKKNKCLFLPYSPMKDETDTQLAVGYAMKKGASTITILGGSNGDRIDHILANILLASQSTIPITFVNGLQKMWIAKGPIAITILGQPGDLLSLIPLSEEVGEIRTENLQYPLKNEPLLFGQPRGISNVFTAKEVEISWKNGLLLFVHTEV